MNDSVKATPHYHLAQVNIARMRAPLDDPIMAEFAALLDEINALADHSPGFVWRFQGETGNATYLRPYDDTRILFNLSVWESVEDLTKYVYQSGHVAVMRRRHEWTEKFDGMYLALWWVKAGHLPTVEDAKQRLQHVRENGESAHAFSFKRVFPPTEEPFFRPARPSDWDQLSRLLAQAKLPLAGVQENLAGFLLGFHHDELIASAGVERYGNHGLLRSIAVAESHRGQQLGSTLIKRLLAESQGNGLEQLVLLTETAEAFFARFGFQRIARQDASADIQSSAEFQSICPQSAVAMRLNLNAAAQT